MSKQVNLDLITRLYHIYLEDLRRVRDFQAKNYTKEIDYRFGKYPAYRFLKRTFKALGISKTGLKRLPSFDDIESEITYLLIREFRPEVTVEISPSGGWSTSWILNALRDNGFGRLYSYDLVDEATKNIPAELSGGRWFFYPGDVMRTDAQLPAKIDYLFMDSDHTSEFADWYVRTLFPRLSPEAFVSVHDVFQKKQNTEAKFMLEWLGQNKKEYFTASPEKEENIYSEIRRIKRKLKIDKAIHYSQLNPAIFFRIKA